MPVADYLTPDTSSQLKKSAEIFSAYLKAKQEAALAQAAKASIDAQGNFDEKKYRTSAMMGGVSPADAQAGVKDAYDWQQRVAAEKAREAAIRRQSETLIDPNTGKPFVAGIGTVDTQQLVLDPRLQRTNATAMAMDAEQSRALQANQRAAQAAQSAQMATALGAPQGAGVGTPVPNATTTEQAILGGGAIADQPQQAPGSEPLMDVIGVDKDTARDLAYGLRTQGLYKDTNDIPGPNMQAALDKWYSGKRQALLEKQPTMIQYPNYGEYLKAKNEWESSLASLPVTAREELAGWRDKRQANVTSRLGNASTRQAMDIAKTNQDQVQDPVLAARADGYKGVYSGNLDKYQTLRGQINWLQSTSDGANELLEKIKQTGNIDPTELQTYLKNFEQAPIAADKVTDVSGKEQMANLFAARKDIQQVIRGSNTLGDLAKNIAKNELAMDTQVKVLSLLKNMVDHQLKHGAAYSELETYRAERKPKTVNEKLKEKITESVPKAGDVPQEKRKVGMKARLGNGKIGTWNGKGWDL